MVFVGDILRSEAKLLLRFDGITETGNLLQFHVLSGFNYAYRIPRGAIETGEVLYFENSATLSDLLKEPNDIIHIFADSFDILVDQTVNIVSLHTCYLYEFFMWQTMPGKLVLNE